MSHLAIIWRCRGIYMDIDVISVRPISENVLAAEAFSMLVTVC